MWKQPSEGGDAPLTQLAGLVVEMERDHPEMLPALAAWFSANGDRVSKGLSGYVVRAQVVTNLSKLNVATYLQAWATKNGVDMTAPIDNVKLAEYLGKAFADPDFAPWVNGVLPTINKEAGRDHWPRVGGGLLAGGGFRTGQIIGATDRLGGEIAERGVHFGEVFASLYKHLGLDPHESTFTDLSGRPHPLVDYQHEVMKELV